MRTQQKYWDDRWDGGLETWRDEMVRRPGHEEWMDQYFNEMGFSEIADGQSVLDIGCACGNNLFLIDKHRTVTYKGIDTHSHPIALAREKAAADSTITSRWVFEQTPTITQADWILLTWVLMEVSEPVADQLLRTVAPLAQVGVIFNYDFSQSGVEERLPSETKLSHGGWLVLPHRYVAAHMAPLTLDQRNDRRFIPPKLFGTNILEIWRR
jgi:2-polyprenyl-3-methyl-5-hydroxy-6-metoxy-1,4-benzoquinol methylase